MAYNPERAKQNHAAWQREQERQREWSRARAVALKKWAPNELPTFIEFAEKPKPPLRLREDLDALAERVHQRLNGTEEQADFELLIESLEAEPAKLALAAQRSESLYQMLLKVVPEMTEWKAANEKRIRELEDGLAQAQLELERVSAIRSPEDLATEIDERLARA